MQYVLRAHMAIILLITQVMSAALGFDSGSRVN